MCAAPHWEDALGPDGRSGTLPLTRSASVSRPRDIPRRRFTAGLLSLLVAGTSHRALAADLKPARLVHPTAAEPTTVGAAAPGRRSEKVPVTPLAPPYGALPKSNTRSHKYHDRFLRPYRGKPISEFWKDFSVELRVAGYDRAIKIFSRPDGF